MRFSIIVPVYNVEKYLRKCVNSVLAQGFEDYELILVDDGSTDGSDAICDDYARKYPERIVTVHQQNSGQSKARNEGVRLAKGEYVTFLDSDDFWRHTYALSDIDAIISKYQPDIVAFDMAKYYEDTQTYIEPSPRCSEKVNGKEKIEILRDFYFRQGDLKIGSSQKFIKRELLKRHLFDENLRTGEDIDWSLNLFGEAGKICVYNKPFYCYRQQREGSVTNSTFHINFLTLINIIDRWREKLLASSLPREEKEIYIGYLAYQLSVAMVFLGRIPGKDAKESRLLVKRNLDLFDYPCNFKTSKVKKLVKIAGPTVSISLLSLFVTLRRMFKKG